MSPFAQAGTSASLSMALRRMIAVPAAAWPAIWRVGARQLDHARHLDDAAARSIARSRPARRARWSRPAAARRRRARGTGSMPSFSSCCTASKRTSRSLPRAESEVALPPSRTVMVPSGLIEMLLSVDWNWIGPPSPSTRSPVAGHELAGGVDLERAVAGVALAARRSAPRGRRRRRSRRRAGCRSGWIGPALKLCQVARSCT